MSQGNLAAAIGLANTNKIPAIGGYVRDESAPGPSADGSYIGVIATQYFDRNVIDEDHTVVGGITVPSTSGVAAGKAAQWVYTGASPVTVAADGLCSVSAGGVVSATATTGLYKTYIPPGTVIPAARWFWVFLV